MQKQESIGFGLIDSWRILEEKKGNLDIGMVEVTLPDWLYQALHKKKMLKISPDYFRIRKAIDRRLYEIARKHCGNHKANDLPDYNIRYDVKTDMVILNNRNPILEQKEKEQQKCKQEFYK